MSTQVSRLRYPISSQQVSRWQLLYSTAILFVFSATAAANPRSDIPAAPLGAHDTIKGAKQEVTRLYALYAAEEKTAVTLSEGMDKPERLPSRQIAQSAGKVWLAARNAEHLQLMGEPAGHDLYRKFKMLHRQFYSLAQAHVGSPPGAKYKNSLVVQLQKETPARNKQLQEGQQMIAQGQLEQAETLLQGLGVGLWEKCVFLSNSERKPNWGAFEPVIGSLDSALTNKRRPLYQQEAMKVISELLTDSRKFTDEAARVRGEIASTGTATLADGRKVNAVDAFAYIAGQWSKSAAMLIRCQGILWAFSGDMGSGNSESPAAKEMRNLADAAKQALASLIEAAAESTPSDQVTATYAGLLREISIINRRAYAGGITSSCEEALKRLASKNPSLTLQAEAYDRATSEPLRWRARFASQQADQLSKEYSSIASQIQLKQVVEKTNRPPVFGKLPAVPRVIAPLTINQPANWAVYEAAGVLLGKNMSDQPLIRLTPTSKTAVVPYATGHYTNVPVPLPVENELAELRRYLIVDESHPPLSIATADAISAAELQDFERIGGMLTRLHLEALVTRCIALPDVASVLVPLGTLPTLSESSPPVNHACWRFDVIPHWAQHKYFTVRPVVATQ